MDNAELLKAIREVVKNEIQPLKDDILELKKDVCAIKSDISVMKEDISEIKEEEAITRTGVNKLLDWADDPVAHDVPLFRAR